MIVAGFGFRGSASVDSFMDAYRLACPEIDADYLATLIDKAQSQAFLDFALREQTPIRHVSAHAASGQKTVTSSVASQTARATGSVAEACALAAAGPGAKLIRTRQISSDGMATCALARGDTT